MKGIDRVFEQVTKMIKSGDYNGVTASDLEGFLDIKRSVISHYLNILLDEGKVFKTNSRPVKYYLSDNVPVSEEKTVDVFESFIGQSGSLRMQVEQCKAAAIYPPDGLPIIINGNSGVGKSYLAFLIYKYAVSNNIIKKEAPFIELNCADYANNPELLSSVLFGYVEGAFTGASKGKKGLMDEADGGYLFLDEIHRLSNENQEKLFIYLDKGKFRRLGENDTWHNVKVRFIFATTENIHKSLLETFYRRIPMKITLPDFQQRPLLEKTALIHSFYKNEAKTLDKDIRIDPEVLNILAFSITKGNIGMLKNYIKLSCASAYKNQRQNSCLTITAEELSEELIKFKNEFYNIKPDESLYIDKHSDDHADSVYDILKINSIEIKNLISSFKNDDEVNIYESITLFNRKIIKNMTFIYGIDFDKSEKIDFKDQLLNLLYFKLNDITAQLSKKYGIEFSKNIKNNLFSVLIYTVYKVYGEFNLDRVQDVIKKIRKKNPKAFFISIKLIESFEDYNQEKYDVLYLLFPLIMGDVVKINTDIQAIIATHGDSTASSISSVANSLCEAYIFEPFDMPINIDSRALVQRVNTYIDQVDTSQGLILLADMGSLQEMYEPIKNHLQGELLIINNVTTYIAVDIGLKILRGDSMQQIIEKSKNSIHTDIKHYEGISKGDNIVISCISGMGIAKKLKKIFENCIPDDKLEIVTLDYRNLKNIIQTKDISQLKKTKLIITTNNLNTKPIPSINIENIIGNIGYKTLSNYLSDVLSDDEIKKISEELVKFFSIEGISSHLSFLNPNIVVNEVETLIKQYEKYYELVFENHIRLNLYMHISIMIERLMLNQGADFKEQKTLTIEQTEFIDITLNAFNKIKEKYNIELPESEILLIYEVLAPEIYKTKNR